MNSSEELYDRLIGTLRALTSQSFCVEHTFAHQSYSHGL